MTYAQMTIATLLSLATNFAQANNTNQVEAIQARAKARAILLDIKNSFTKSSPPNTQQVGKEKASVVPHILPQGGGWCTFFAVNTVGVEDEGKTLRCVLEAYIMPPCGIVLRQENKHRRYWMSFDRNSTVGSHKLGDLLWPATRIWADPAACDTP